MGNGQHGDIPGFISHLGGRKRENSFVLLIIFLPCPLTPAGCPKAAYKRRKNRILQNMRYRTAAAVTWLVYLAKSFSRTNDVENGWPVIHTNLFVCSLSHTHHEEKHPGKAEALKEDDHGKDDDGGDCGSPQKGTEKFFGRKTPQLLQGLGVEKAIEKGKER